MEWSEVCKTLVLGTLYALSLTYVDNSIGSYYSYFKDGAYESQLK